MAKSIEHLQNICKRIRIEIKGLKEELKDVEDEIELHIELKKKEKSLTNKKPKR